MHRRSFIATTCLACIGAGSGALAGLLSSCAASDVITGELVGGQIRVPLPPPGEAQVHIVRANGFPDTIALVRQPGGGFHALVLRCTHADNPLQQSGGGFSCSLHGSRFDADGNVTRGPARRPLRRLETAVDQGAIVISVDADRAAGQ